MYTIEEVKEIFKTAENHYNSLMSIYRDEVKEEGKARENTIIYINALFYQFQEATKCIEKGLKGEF